MLTELQGEQEKLSSTTKELIEEHNRKQKHIDVSSLLHTNNQFECFSKGYQTRKFTQKK